MTTYESNEIESNEKAAAVKLNLDTENRYLTTKIAELQAELSSELVNLQNLENQFEECLTTYNSFMDSYNAENQDLADSTQSYNTRLKTLTDEVELFTEVVYLYQTEVASASDDYKARADDYLDDETFNSSEDFNSQQIYDVMDDGSTGA